MLMNQNNVLYVFVADTAQAGLSTGNVTSLAEGNVGVAKADGTLVDSAVGAADIIKLVKKVNGILQYSPEFKKNDIVASSIASHVSDTQFVGYLGYNTASGDLTVSTDTVYTPKLVVKTGESTYGNKSMIKEVVYKTGKTAPVYKCDLAVEIANAFNKAMDRESERYVKAVAVSSIPGSGTVTLTAGSNIAVLDAAITTAKVGDFVRDTQEQTYKIVKLDGQNATLNQAALVSDAAGTYVEEADAQSPATLWGVKFIGQARTHFEPGIYKNFVYDFEILPGANLEDVLVTENHAISGTCTGRQVAEEEWFAQGNRGYGDRIDAIPVKSQVTADPDFNSYHGLYVKTSQAQFTNVVGQSPASLAELKVYGVDTLINDIKTVLGI
jgi:hypothetical protein